MRSNGEAYTQASQALNQSADQYEDEATRTEQAVSGITGDGLAERHRTVVKAMRNQAAVCQSMGQQCYDVADSTLGRP
jgi:hypothetical protein